MKSYRQNDKGFTLVELLIVVIILGILAAVAIPQFGDSTEEAREETLNANLATLRSAIELYKAHHGVYPGRNDVTGTITTGDMTAAATAFRDQLILYTDGTGIANADSSTLTGTVYGPYLKKDVPENPFPSGTATNTVVCVDNTSLTLANDGTTGNGWIFNVETGRIIANDGAHDAN